MGVSGFWSVEPPPSKTAKDQTSLWDKMTSYIPMPSWGAAAKKPLTEKMKPNVSSEPVAELPIWQKALLFMASPIKYLKGTAEVSFEKKGSSLSWEITKIGMVLVVVLMLILLSYSKLKKEVMA